MYKWTAKNQRSSVLNIILHRYLFCQAKNETLKHTGRYLIQVPNFLLANIKIIYPNMRNQIAILLHLVTLTTLEK